MRRNISISLTQHIRHRLMVACGAVTLTLILFLVLPLLQAITNSPQTDLMVLSVDTVDVPPPPPPPEEEPEEEKEEPEPLKLAEEAPPLDLSQLELALNPEFSDGWTTGDFTVNLKDKGGQVDDVEALFSMSDLDQKPRVIYQPGPLLNDKLRQKAPGTVYVIFLVDKSGGVVEPMVQNTTDPIFERPALDAVKKWKFEPGKRNGQPVRFRMRVPISFQKG